MIVNFQIHLEHVEVQGVSSRYSSSRLFEILLVDLTMSTTSFQAGAFSIEQPAITKNSFRKSSIQKATTLTSLLPVLLRYLVETMYDALTVRTTAFIRFFADVINDVALSS